jgi:hypothetical protein
MQPAYTFTLKPQKQHAYTRMALIVAALHLITYIVTLFKTYPENILLPLAGIFVVGAYFFLQWLIKQKRIEFKYPEIFFYLLAIWWLFAAVYWMAAVVLLFAIVASFLKEKVKINFTQAAIRQLNFPMRTYNWADVSNVVLKDGLLTIDFKNNRMIQQLVEENTDEAAFTAFCNAAIAAE